MREDVEYYRARALTERDAAEAACQPNIAAIHLQLAEHYEALLRSNGSGAAIGSGALTSAPPTPLFAAAKMK